ncbi:MAG TPA: phosphatase PAP2 family protein [Candidatus Acidoferrales bacterium]|nr:phosphatase PAP2 family protein [Candidatus Acidoferrales bacterium]
MNRVAPLSPTLFDRLRAHLGFKLALAVGLNLGAFAPYFWLQRNPYFPVTFLPQSQVDVWIGFRPDAVWVYLSLFLLMPVGPMLMEESSQLRRYACGVAAMSVAADLVFLFWPTAVTRPRGDGANLIYRTLVAWDMPLNAFPSLHAAMAVFSARCCEQLFQRADCPGIWRAAVWTWVAAIIWAMLATKQHVALDAVGGILLGAFAYEGAFRCQAARAMKAGRKRIRTEGWTL